MAAYVKVMTEEEARFIEKLLDAPGLVLVTPKVAKALQEKHGIELNELDGKYLEDYSYGGEADVWIDMALKVNAYSTQAIISLLKGCNATPII